MAVPSAALVTVVSVAGSARPPHEWYDSKPEWQSPRSVSSGAWRLSRSHHCPVNLPPKRTPTRGKDVLLPVDCSKEVEVFVRKRGGWGGEIQGESDGSGTHLTREREMAWGGGGGIGRARERQSGSALGSSSHPPCVALAGAVSPRGDSRAGPAQRAVPVGLAAAAALRYQRPLPRDRRRRRRSHHHSHPIEIP